jgi:DNA mismatch repair protein MutS2
LEPNSLVLIDEAGSGTDPEEGGALFQSFVEKIINLKSRVIITTHHGSLKVFAHESDHVVNGAMEFNQKHLTPTYRFKKGVPGSSYAFEIADRMHLPSDLMDRARNLLGDKRDRMGDLLISLEKSVQKSEEVVREHESKLTKLVKREKTLTEQADNYERKKNKILEKAYKDAEEIMLTANQRIEEAVEKVVKEGRENKESIREARGDIKQKKSEISDERENLEKINRLKEIAASEKPVVGDFVLIGESDTPGELIEVTGQRVTISMNGMRVKSTLNKLTKTIPPKKKKKTDHAYSFRVSEGLNLSVKPSLDLRGMRGDDAIAELTIYLDKALASGYRQVEIIHGKGEGILHQLVHKTLNEREEVHSFEIAPWESGGTGCTIVNL